MLGVGILWFAAARAATHDVEAGSDWAAVISEAASGDTIRVRDTAPAPEEYPWLSAAFHLGRRKRDPLVEDRSLLGLIDGGSTWRRFLREGIEEEELGRIESHLSSGLPLGSEEFVRRLEEETGRVLTLRRGGWPRGKSRKRRAEA